MSELKRKTANSFFWGGVSNFIQQVLSLLFGIYLARTLTVEDYGLVGMLTIFTAIAGLITTSGFGLALVNKQDAGDKEYNAVFWFTFLVGIICYITLFFSAPLIANFYHRSELISLSRVVFLSFFISSIGLVSSAILTKKMMIKQIALIDIISMSISGIIGLSVAMLGYKYWALAIQSLVYVTAISSMRVCVAGWLPSLKLDLNPLRSMFSFSSKLFFTGICQQFNNNIFSILLGKYYTAIQVGYYSQGYKWMWMARSLIAGMFTPVVQPIFVRVREDDKRKVKIFRKILRFCAFITFPLMLGLALIAEDFLVVLIGDKWLSCVPILQLLCVWAIIDVFAFLYLNILIVYERSNIYLGITALLGLVQILVAYLMLPFGVQAMVYAYVFIYFVYFLLLRVLVYRNLAISLLELIKDILPYLFITIFVLWISYYFTKEIDIIIVRLISRILLSAILYTITMWLTNSTIFFESLRFIIKKNKEY